MTVYTDGSSSGTSTGPIGWAWYCDDSTWEAGGELDGTNNVAEISAILQCSSSLPLTQPLVIVTDSQYAIGAVFKWYAGWERDGWRTSTGGEVKNVDLIKATREAVFARRASTLIKHVRGHGKDKNTLTQDLHGNRLADMLAVEVRNRVKEGGQVEVATPFSREIIHGRGRKKLPFTDPVDF